MATPSPPTTPARPCFPASPPDRRVQVGGRRDRDPDRDQVWLATHSRVSSGCSLSPSLQGKTGLVIAGGLAVPMLCSLIST